MSNKREVQGLEVVASLHQHFDGRKRIQFSDGVYDQDAGWGAHIDQLIRKSDADARDAMRLERIATLEGRNAALVAALDHIMKMQLRGYIVLGEMATTQAQAALTQQEATQ